MNTICVNQRKIKKYPSKTQLFRPHIAYPEYIFKDDISSEFNEVYDMVRECFNMLGMDVENFGHKKWNPFNQIIKPGNTVLIKPNLVLDVNGNNCGEDCLYTNPSLVAAVIDYVLIALNGSGKVIVGDAPLQECNFNKLVEESGYLELINYYKGKGIDVELVDFRNVKTYVKDGVHYMQAEEQDSGVIVHLDEKSAFNGMSENHIKNLRITNYDPRILQNHHDVNHHEYNVAKYILDADVIINMPKPKTHRKAGVTIALKNLVGINANKEFLPHHTLGGKEEGGDAYLNGNDYLSLANQVLDIKNRLVHDEQMECAKAAEQLYQSLVRIGRRESKEEYWEGSWYGNDTIWRTILDLNRILLYADKKGVIQKETQRKSFIVADMIVSGQKEGPLTPVPIYSNVIAMGQDPLWFDRVICSLMGFDYKSIPTLFNKQLDKTDLPITENNDYCILSNNELWNNKSIEYILENASLEFEPTYGWLKKLGNRHRKRMISTIKKEKGQVYIFGAGFNGIYAAGVLMEESIEIKGFVDNSPNLWGIEIIPNVTCTDPGELDKNALVVIAVTDKHVSEIESQLRKYDVKVMGVINKGL